MDELVEILAMGLCAKTAIANGGSGHGQWWELGDEAKEAFLDIASALLAEHTAQKWLDRVQEENNSPALFSPALSSQQGNCK